MARWPLLVPVPRVSLGLCKPSPQGDGSLFTRVLGEETPVRGPWLGVQCPQPLTHVEPPQEAPFPQLGSSWSGVTPSTPSLRPGVAARGHGPGTPLGAPYTGSVALPRALGEPGPLPPTPPPGLLPVFLRGTAAGARPLPQARSQAVGKAGAWYLPPGVKTGRLCFLLHALRSQDQEPLVPSRMLALLSPLVPGFPRRALPPAALNPPRFFRKGGRTGRGRVSGPRARGRRAEGVRSHFSGTTVGELATGWKAGHGHLGLSCHTEVSPGRRGKGREVLIAPCPLAQEGTPRDALPGPTSRK